MTDNAIGHLKDISRAMKPAKADEDWILAVQIYEDQSREATIARLADLGVGLKANERPLEVGMLRRIIDRLAVVYDQPPTRWLRKGRRRLSESNAEHEAMTEVLKRAQYDLAWGRIDRLRSLCRQVAVRFYPSDARGSVVLRVFEPYNVLREPDSGAADQIESDKQFALLLEKRGTEELWEWWKREGDVWTMRRVNQAGEMKSSADQPFASSDLKNPYSQLPVMLVYDELPQGRAWLPPRASRTAWSQAINAIANDLWSLVTHQAHSRQVLKTDDPANAPTVTSHGGIIKLERDDDYKIETPNPKIAECQNVLEDLIKLWSLSEDLPAAEFDKAKQVVTGAALLVQERALISRREAQVPLALEDERIAFKKLRAVHNLHTQSKNKPPAWDLPELDEDTELEVEIADVSEPVDIKQLQDAAFRDMVAKLASSIDYLQKRDGVPRHVAIETYKRIQEDHAAFPVGELISEEGPRAAKPPGDGGAEESKNGAEMSESMKKEAMGVGAAERLGKPSVVGAMKSAVHHNG